MGKNQRKQSSSSFFFFFMKPNCSFLLLLLTWVDPWRKKNESLIIKHINNFFILLLHFHTIHLSFLLLLVRRGRPFIIDEARILLASGSTHKKEEQWSQHTSYFIPGKFNQFLKKWLLKFGWGIFLGIYHSLYVFGLVYLSYVYLCAFGLWYDLLFKTNYSLLLIGAFISLEEALEAFRCW